MKPSLAKEVRLNKNRKVREKSGLEEVTIKHKVISVYTVYTCCHSLKFFSINKKGIDPTPFPFPKL